MHRPWRRVAGAVALVVVAGACARVKEAAQSTFVPVTPGRLTVATALPAPGFWDGDEPAAVDGGFEYGIAAALAERFGLELDVVDLPFEQIAGGDLPGADLAMAQITITDARREVLDFSTPYVLGVGHGAVARAGEELADLSKARAATWAVAGGTTQQEFVDEVIRPTEAPVLTDTPEDAVEAVAGGTVEAALVDLPTGLVLAAGSTEVEVVSRFVTSANFGAALPKGSTNRSAVDQALRSFAADGTIDDLWEAWMLPAFGDVNPDDIPVVRAR